MGTVLLKCELVHCGAFLEERLVAGRVTVVCPQCERRRQGICRDCPDAVDGAVGKAVRCARHRREAQREAERRRMADPATRKQRNAKARRALARSPQRKAKKQAARKAWARANPDKVKRQKRRYLLKQTDAYVSYQRAYNARPERQEKKRAAALEAYYRDHPVRPDPHCRTCNVAIPWEPAPGGSAGRPPTLCWSCCPLPEFKRRLERALSRLDDATRAAVLASGRADLELVPCGGCQGALVWARHAASGSRRPQRCECCLTPAVLRQRTVERAQRLEADAHTIARQLGFPAARVARACRCGVALDMAPRPASLVGPIPKECDACCTPGARADRVRERARRVPVTTSHARPAVPVGAPARSPMTTRTTSPSHASSLPC